MSEHTPGPWEQSHRKTPADMWNTQVYTPDGEIICTLHWYPKPKDADGRIGTYRDANARLIAAAPELLEALRSIQWGGNVDGFPACPSCGRDNEEGHSPVCRISLALAKAKGES